MNEMFLQSLYFCTKLLLNTHYYKNDYCVIQMDLSLSFLIIIPVNPTLCYCVYTHNKTGRNNYLGNLLSLTFKTPIDSTPNLATCCADRILCKLIKFLQDHSTGWCWDCREVFEPICNNNFMLRIPNDSANLPTVDRYIPPAICTEIQLILID